MNKTRCLTVVVALFCQLTLLAATSLGSDTFRFRLPADPSTLDWTAASTNFETYVLMNIMEGLVEIDDRLQPVPALADSWDVSKDGLTYTFHLRSGVKWTDGVALTARDFVTSWRRLLAPGTTNDYAAFLFDIEHAEEFHKGRIKDFAKVGIRALDAQHLQVTLRRVVPYFVSLLSFWVTFPQREDLIRKKDWTSPEHLVTLGPYRVSKWLKGKEIDFERNPAYYGKAPAVSHVVAYVEPESEKARKLFYDDRLDVLLDVAAQDLVDFSPATGRRLMQFEYIASVFLAFNIQAPPFVSSDLRHAVSQSLDLTGLQAALKGGQVAADSLIPRGIAGYETASSPVSIDQARKSLLAAGFRSASTVPPLRLLAIQNKHEAAAEYIRDTLRRALDVTVSINYVPPSEYLRLRKAGHYSMMIWQWGADYPDAASFMELFLSDNPVNTTGWKNSRYDALVQQAGGSLKVLERLRAYSEAQHLLLQEDAVVVPLYYPKITALVSPRVREFEINALNYLFFKRITLK